MPIPEIDPTIILKGAYQAPDPLALASKATALGQGMLQNRMTQMQVQGQEATGEAIRRATGADGQTDWSKAASYVAAGPAAYAAPGVKKDALALQLAELQNKGADLDLYGKRAEKITGLTGGLLAQKEPLTKEGVVSTLSELVTSGMIKDAEGLQQLATFIQSLPNEDKAIRAKLGQTYVSYGDVAQRIAALKGPVSSVDTGPAIVQQQISPLTGEVAPVATLQKGLSPEGASTPTPVITRNADGSLTPSAVTRQQFVDAAGEGPVMTGAPLSREGLTPETLAQLITVKGPNGEDRKVTLGSLLGQPVGSPTAPLASPGGVVAGLAPGAAEAASATAGQGVQLSTKWVQEAEAAPERVAQIHNIRDQIGSFSSGPQASWQYRLKALGTQLGLATKEVKDDAAAQEEFNKLAQQFINSGTQQLGEGTDSKLAASLKASPNEFMTQQGLTGVLSLMEGVENAKLAKAEAWQRWLAAGNKPGSEQQFQSQWNKLFNLRVFQAQHMDEKQRANMFSRMSPAEKKSFQKDWTTALKAGWIQ